MPQVLPSSATEYARTERAELGAALASLLRIWRHMGSEFDESWARIEGDVLTVLDTAQERMAAEAVSYIPRVLEETGQRVRDPQYEFDAGALVGTAGDGRPTDTLAYGAVTTAKQAVANGAPVGAALAQGGRFLLAAAGTVLSDTGRTAEKVSGHARGVGSWVRMLNPPSCGRCVILAGKSFRTSQAFERHPKCDCRNIPASESVAGDLLVDPHEYLDDLDDAGLVRALGSKANAEAWREGADANQLINAYRRAGAVSKAQQYGRAVKYTTEGTTRRGIAYYRMSQAGYARRQAEVRAGGSRYFRSSTVRLMPETIFEIASDRADAVRLLRLYGWMA